MTLISTENQITPLEIWEVMLGDSIIKFFDPLILTPTWMPDDPDEPSDDQYLQVIYPKLAIDTYGEDRDDLLEAVHSNIRMNWKHYVLSEDSGISPQVKAIKQAYLGVAEVVDG